MTAFAMESRPAQFGSDFVDGVRRFFYRAAAAVAILLLLGLLFVLFVPMAIIGVLYILVRSVLGGFGGAGRAAADSQPAHQPIPEADNEGRENVRVRRSENE